MSAMGERTLVLLLTDTESLQVIAREAVDPVILPTVGFRAVLDWSLTYLAANGKAPTIALVKERWGNVYEDNQVDPEDDVEEGIEWAIDNLKVDYAKNEVAKFTRELALGMANSDPEEVLAVLGERASSLSRLYFTLQPRTTRMDLRESGQMLLDEYEQAASSNGVRGMRFGFPAIDQHYGGIWPGELFTLAGPPGTGKSFVANMVAYNEWARGEPVALFTLENSILMAQMRIACMALGLSIEDLQTGNLSDEEVTLLREWCNDVLPHSDTPLHILSPDMVGRTPQAVVQTTKALGVSSLIIDQLSHLQGVDGNHRDRRNEVSAIIQTLVNSISTGRDRVSCLLMHQVNREGIKRAAATGRISMVDMAESSEVERSSSVVATLYASDEHKVLGRMQWQTLKQRRVKANHWDLDWAPHRGVIHVINEVDFSGVE